MKDESRNPTGSFMDRGVTVLASLAKLRGVKECSCVTTGNLGSSLAAYCAKAGLVARIKIHPSTDRGKLYQMLAYGAHIEVPSRHHGWSSGSDQALLVTAGNPYLLEGEKTTCFETVHELGWRTPDAIVVPVGTGGHLSMTWRAITQMRESGLIENSTCRLFGVHVSGASTSVGDQSSGTRADSTEVGFTELEESEPFFIGEAGRAVRESGGQRLATTAVETLDATRVLARTEGIFAEPASASVIASLRAATEHGLIHRDDVVVCVITSAGLKDPKAISKLMRGTGAVSLRGGFEHGSMQLGETKLALLRSLSSRRRYGYELWRDLLSARTITTASVYQHLSELEGFGLIRKAGVTKAQGRERVLYELTKKGMDFQRITGRLAEAAQAGGG